MATSVIRNGSRFSEDPDSSWDMFSITEASRLSQSALEDMTESGILLFSLLTETAVACWNSKQPFTPDNIHIVEQVCISTSKVKSPYYLFASETRKYIKSRDDIASGQNTIRRDSNNYGGKI